VNTESYLCVCQPRFQLIEFISHFAKVVAFFLKVVASFTKDATFFVKEAIKFLKANPHLLPLPSSFRFCFFSGNIPAHFLFFTAMLIFE